MIKKTLNKIFSNRIICAVLSFLIAICLWFYVVGVENPEQEFEVTDIPITYTGVDGVLSDRGLMLASGRDATVDLKLRAPRTVRTKLDRQTISVTVDVSNITTTGDYIRTLTITWPSNVSDSDIVILSQSSKTVEFSIARQASKTIPLKGVLDEGCVVAEGYVAEEFEFNPNEIVIHGPEALIEQVDHALVTISRTNISETLELTSQYTLVDHEGNPVVSGDIIPDVEEVYVRLPVLMQKKIWLRVDVKDGGGATSDSADIRIEPEYIVVAGDPEVLSTYNSITLGSINLSEVISSYSETLPIVLINGVENVSGETEASVRLTLEGLATRSLTVTQFEFKNIPEGYEAISETKSLRVNIRGEEEAVEQLLESNLVAVADLSGLVEGTMSVPVEIQINSKTTAGVMGNYSIYVRVGNDLLQEEEEEPLSEPGDE